MRLCSAYARRIFVMAMTRKTSITGKRPILWAGTDASISRALMAIYSRFALELQPIRVYWGRSFGRRQDYLTLINALDGQPTK